MPSESAIFPEENVWSYLRPPKLERVEWEFVIRFADTDIVDDLSFYVHKGDECSVGGINVVAQMGHSMAVR